MIELKEFEMSFNKGLWLMFQTQSDNLSLQDMMFLAEELRNNNDDDNNRFEIDFTDIDISDMYFDKNQFTNNKVKMYIKLKPHHYIELKNKYPLLEV